MLQKYRLISYFHTKMFHFYLHQSISNQSNLQAHLLLLKLKTYRSHISTHFEFFPSINSCKPLQLPKLEQAGCKYKILLKQKRNILE